jgi:hypothetical protein
MYTMIREPFYGGVDYFVYDLDDYGDHLIATIRAEYRPEDQFEADCNRWQVSDRNKIRNWEFSSLEEAESFVDNNL